VKAVKIYRNFNKSIEEKIESILDNAPKTEFDYKTWATGVPRRKLVTINSN